MNDSGEHEGHHGLFFLSGRVPSGELPHRDQQDTLVLRGPPRMN